MSAGSKKLRYFDSVVDNGAGGENVQVFNIKIDPKKFKRKPDYKKKNKEQRTNEPKFPGKAPIDPVKLEKYDRGEGVTGQGVIHPLHLEKLKRKEKFIKYAQEQATRTEILHTEVQGGIETGKYEKTTSINQTQIAKSVDIAAATKIFNLELNDFGPYRVKYSRNGRQLLLAGKKGHVAAFDWVTKKLHCELNVMESIHDISLLHIETMYAVAQKEWLYIYDNNGIEIHCVKRMNKVLKMEYLPYHFLLATINEFGHMSWLDISLGEIVGSYYNKMGRTTVMTQNPYNATICLGGSKGVVTIWSPTVKDPLAKILCQKAPLTAIAIDPKGMYMATSGVERSLKIWDIRNLDGPLQHYKLRSAPVDLDFSQKEMLAVGLDELVEVYSNCCSQTTEKPYMRHRMSKMITNHKFCPYEDVLGIGTNKGFTSIIVPGSGEANFDALETNPFQTVKQRREAEVKALLDKIPADLITLDPFEVAQVDVPSLQQIMESKSKLKFVKPKSIDYSPRKSKKGRTSIARKKIIKETARKQYIDGIIEDKKSAENIEEEQAKPPQKSYGVLDRFVKKKK